MTNMFLPILYGMGMSIDQDWIHANVQYYREHPTPHKSIGLAQIIMRANMFNNSALISLLNEHCLRAGVLYEAASKYYEAAAKLSSDASELWQNACTAAEKAAIERGVAQWQRMSARQRESYSGCLELLASRMLPSERRFVIR